MYIVENERVWQIALVKWRRCDITYNDFLIVITGVDKRRLCSGHAVACACAGLPALYKGPATVMPKAKTGRKGSGKRKAASEPVRKPVRILQKKYEVGK